jgi:hypothetical protein
MTSHLHEERLFDCYWLARGGEALDPPTAEHLTDCPECASRYRELTQFLDGLREDGDAEVDELYSADALSHQQHQIARRLETVGRSARVLAFPHAAPVRQLPTATRRRFPRWVAATAAAGLFAGVGAGMFFSHASNGSPVAATRPTAAVTAAAVPAAADFLMTGDSDTDGHEYFMSELALAADRPRTAELEAYDELTPHIRAASFLFAGR